MIGKTISHYRILEKLGEGGMGVVYKARDTKLDRFVALKFLPPHLSQDEENKQRFIHEAKAASALDHPNICTIYEIGETEDRQMFIAMACYDGESLKEGIEHGPLPIDDAVDIAIQIAQGLEKAHSRKIVHRDIKPANVLITDDDQVKIVDFGLAKLIGHTMLTKESMTLGTVAYMSPEQTQGTQVDHRTDIWSLGVVLYKMLTGQHPFKGDYQQAVIYSILNEEPEQPQLVRSDLPDHLGKIISKSLEKEPDRRYQNLSELLQDLQACSVSSSTASQPEKSIVVLPFENISPDPEQEYFSDGLTEEIIADLSHIHDLRVISRTSAMMLKGTKKDMKTIGRELNVKYVLEGSVRKAGNNLRITAQLIDATSDAHIWAEKYSGTLDDVFDIQEKVSRSIVDALKLKLTPEENKKMTERPIDNVQGYEWYLRARREIWTLTEDGLERALQDLQNGLSVVGENALLYAGMGLVYCNYYEFGIKVEEEILQKAEEYAFKALRLEPDCSSSYSLLGRIERFRGSSSNAIKNFKRALEIDPNDTEALIWLSLAYSWQVGKADSSGPLIKKLFAIDPLYWANHMPSCLLYWMQGNLDDALSSLNKMRKLEPENVLPDFWSAYILAWKGQFNDVYTLIDRMVKKETQDTMHKLFTEWLLFFKYALKGDKKRALGVLTEEVKHYFWHDPELPWLGACNYALIDEKEEALNWLEHVINKGWINYPLFNEIDPLLENIRGEERFKKLMEQIKPEWESFEV